MKINLSVKKKRKHEVDLKRNTKPAKLNIGALVLCKQQRKNKVTALSDPKPYTIIKTELSKITSKRNGIIGKHPLTNNFHITLSYISYLST